jgi:hypothetical protein
VEPPESNLQVVAPSGKTFYRPSGKISVLRFVPLLLLAILVAVVMAFVLYLLEARFYYFFVTPILVALPVMGAYFLLIHFGRCRNPLLAGVAGAVLALLYYVGYWEISYQRNVVSKGPFLVQMVEAASGQPGLIGYIKFRCGSSVISSSHGRDEQKKHDASDTVFAYVFHGGELLVLLALGVAGSKLARRAYFERFERWAEAVSFRYGGEDFEAVYRAVMTNDWPALAAVPKASGQEALKPSLEFRVEHLRDVLGEPMYLSLTGLNLPKELAARAPGRMGAGKTMSFLKQQALPPEATPLLAQHFPELIPAGVQAAAAAQGIALPAAQVEYSSGLKGALEQAGLSQPKITGPDFREPAARESEAIVAASGAFARLTELNRSLCLLAGPNPGKALKSVSLLHLKILGLVMLMLFGGLGLAAFAEDDKSAAGKVLLTVGAVIAAAGLVVFLALLVAGEWIIKQSLTRRFRRRQGSFLEVSQKLPSLAVRVENAHTHHIAKTTTEDVGICFLDESNRRLLIEGVSHRYLIQGADVIEFDPIDSETTAAVRLRYRIGNSELPIVLSHFSLGRAAAMSFSPGSAANSAHMITARLARALGLAPA